MRREERLSVIPDLVEMGESAWYVANVTQIQLFVI